MVVYARKIAAYTDADTRYTGIQINSRILQCKMAQDQACCWGGGFSVF